MLKQLKTSASFSIGATFLFYSGIYFVFHNILFFSRSCFERFYLDFIGNINSFRSLEVRREISCWGPDLQVKKQGWYLLRKQTPVYSFTHNAHETVVETGEIITDFSLCFQTSGLSERLNDLLGRTLSHRAVPFIQPVSAGVHHYRWNLTLPSAAINTGLRMTEPPNRLAFYCRKLSAVMCRASGCN